MRKFIYLLLLFSSALSFAQKKEVKNTCFSDNLREEIIKKDPLAQKNIDLMDLELSKIENSKKTSSAMITIPVVFYVVHDNQAPGVGSNLSDDQVDSQLTVLNSYFNAYGLKFCYATKAGASNISSINHINNTALSNHTTPSQAALENAGMNATSSQVDKSRYLRIYIVKSIDGSNSGVLGYATFPNSSDFDGIVMRYNAVGDATLFPSGTYLPNYDKGKVLIHEIGHYLGLYHTFQESCAGMNLSTCSLEGDRICDTPPVNTPNFDCVSNTDSCIEDSNLPDDIQNFMDYGDNVCQEWFTEGQKNRMLNVLATYRSSLISPDNIIYTATCGSSSLISASFSPNTYQACTTTAVSFTPISTGTGITYLWDFGDSTSSTLVNPSHIFASAVNSPYTVTLTISNGTDSFVSISKIFVSVCNPILNSETNWRFGRFSAGSPNSISFSSGVPVLTLQTDDDYLETSSIVSDSNGQILFKSTGTDVTNNSLIFRNAISGHVSAHRGTLIVKNPNPLFPNQYYLFVKDASDQTSKSGFRYNLVDAVSPTNVSINPANLNIAATVPSGNGYVLTPNGGIEGGEGVTAISAQDGYWIITTGKKATGYFFMVFKLDATGLTFVSETQTMATAAHSGLNSLEVSPNGDRILLILDASTNPIASNRGTHLYDFNKFTGEVVPNVSDLNLYIYGASFSPNSNLLYVNNTNTKNYQINLQDTNSNTTRKIFHQSNVYSIGDIQRGPDNKLYFTSPRENTKSLYVIHNPNELITTENPNACNFSKNGPTSNVIQHYTAGGLPNMINSKKETAFETNAISSYPSSCYIRRFFPDSYGTSFNWDFGDPLSGANNTYSGTLVTHTFSGNGTYTVTLKSATNVFIAQTTITIGIPPITILGSSTACVGENNITNNSVALTPGQTAVWTITGGIINGLNNQSDVTVNWTTLPGTITLTVTNGSGCTATATRTIVNECLACQCISSISFDQTPQLDDYYRVNLYNGGSVCSGVTVRNTWQIGNRPPFTTTGLGGIGYISTGMLPITLTIEALDAYGNVICTKTTTGASEMRQGNNEINNVKEILELKCSITPNPSSGLITIQTNNFNGKINLDVIDINGRVVYTLKDTLFNSGKTIDLSNLQSGMYIIKLNGENLNYTDKIILN